MRWFAALLTQPRRFFMVFVAGELLLAMAIPFVAIEGYHTLLESRAGKFTAEPTRIDPGWRALVDPTSVTGIVEVDGETVTGITLLVHHPGLQSGGTAVLVPGSLEAGGATLSARAPAEAVEALSLLIDLSISRVDVLDSAAWSSVLGTETYLLDSPDPVLDDSGNELFAVGPVEVNATNVSAFLGRPAPGAVPISVSLRRHIFWKAFVSSPSGSDAPLAVDLRAMDGTTSQVVDLPLAQEEPAAIADVPAIESLIRDVVAYPTGSTGHRLQVRILDRTGAANLEGIAAAVAALGHEVIEIGNAREFDDGVTQVIAPVALSAEGGLPDNLYQLSLSVGVENILVDNDLTEDLTEDVVVTVVIGRDFDLANLS